MLAALPVIVGIQCWIAFLHHDVSNVPTEPLSGLLDETD
jgi:dolichol-phosphate mannosyltransferase